MVKYRDIAASLIVFLSIGWSGEAAAQTGELLDFQAFLNQEKYEEAALLTPKLQDWIRRKPRIAGELVETLLTARETLPPTLVYSLSDTIFKERPWDAADRHQQVMNDLFSKLTKLDGDDVKRLYYDTIWASAKSSFFSLSDDFFATLRSGEVPEIDLYKKSIDEMAPLSRLQGTTYASRAAAHIVLVSAWLEAAKPGASDAVAGRTDEICGTYTGGNFAWKSFPGSWRQANDIHWNCAIWDVARKRIDAARLKFKTLAEWKTALSAPGSLPAYDIKAITAENPEFVDSIFVLYFKPRGKKHSLRYGTQKLGRYGGEALEQCAPQNDQALTCLLGKLDTYFSAEIKLRLGTFSEEASASREKSRLAANRRLKDTIAALQLQVRPRDVAGQRLWVLETDYSLTLAQAREAAKTISDNHDFLRPLIIAPRAF